MNIQIVISILLCISAYPVLNDSFKALANKRYGTALFAFALAVFLFTCSFLVYDNQD